MEYVMKASLRLIPLAICAFLLIYSNALAGDYATQGYNYDYNYSGGNTNGQAVSAGQVSFKASNNFAPNAMNNTLMNSNQNFQQSRLGSNLQKNYAQPKTGNYGGLGGNSRTLNSVSKPSSSQKVSNSSGKTDSPGDEKKRGKYLGQFGGNEFNLNSTRNLFGAGNQFNSNSINNKYGKYGSKYSPNSARNPHATNSPKLYDSDGNYRGKLSNNPYDPESISNPYGRYGNKYSSDSINNPYGAGNPYSSDSPNNPYGKGLSIYGEE